FFLWSGRSYYVRYHNLSDQRAGGGGMLVEGTLVMVGVVVCLLRRSFAESERRERLLAAGIVPTAAARAARYGRAWLAASTFSSCGTGAAARIACSSARPSTRIPWTY